MTHSSSQASTLPRKLLAATARGAATTLACVAAVSLGVPAAHVGLAAHNFALLLTLVFGILAATWWRHSAVLANLGLDAGSITPLLSRDINTLNAAAATATGLGLIASGYTSLRWDTFAAWVSFGAFVATVAIFGHDLDTAVGISSRENLLRRSALSSALILVLVTLFLTRRDIA